MTQADLIALLIETAPRLRAAGITSVEVPGMKATLLPDQPLEVESGEETTEEEFDVLHDPATFGHSSADRVPGRRRRTK